MTKMKPAQLKELVIKLKENDDALKNADELKVINSALKHLDEERNFPRAVMFMHQDIEQYSLSHNFKLPKSLYKLNTTISENADKWIGAGYTALWL